MDDETPRSSETEDLNIGACAAEDEILKEFNTKQPIKHIPFDQHTASFIVPAYEGYNEKVIRLEETDCRYKKLIFSAIYTASYQAFVLGEQPKSWKDELHTFTNTLTDYLNQYEFKSEKEINFFKDFEANRINTDKVKPKSTGLDSLLRWLKSASEFHHFNINSTWQTHFIDSVFEIKVLRNNEVEQKTLPDWFGYSTWLREDDVGVGHDLYARLASPKALMISFITTITVQLNEIQSAKAALIDFFKANNVQPSDFLLISKKAYQTDSEFTLKQYQAINVALIKLQALYHLNLSTNDANGYLKLALQLVIRECVRDRYFEIVERRFFANEQLIIYKKSNGIPYPLSKISSHEALFSLRFLNQLAIYAQSRDDQTTDKPKTVGEQTIFAWLMAYQTVQPSDVEKLKLKDFRFVCRNNGRITHIDLEYFKGRANSIHQVRTLEINTLLGQVVLAYIQDLSYVTVEDKEKALIAKTNTGLTAITKLFESCDLEIKASIERHLTKENASSVFIESMLKILRNGIRRDFRKQNISNYNKTCKRRVQKGCFSLTAIKNSSVHARSDTFTPTQLINYHSHSDAVERKSYLSESNLEWLNRSGLITRAVMNDMTTNLFRASDKDRAEFISEFTQAAETIKAKKNNTLARMKLITEKSDGQIIDDLGFVKKPPSTEGDMPDTIYLLDTPETIVKLLHYRAEAQRLHYLLASSAPEFLLFTVLPTAEWIEELFDQKSFSKSSTDKGQALYKQFKNHLSPLFHSQLR